MALLGTSVIYICLVATFYAVVTSLIGVRLGNNKLNLSSRNTVLLLSVFLLAATLILVISFVNNDFGIRYVSEHSSLAMKPIYTWVAFYAGNEGSLLYSIWVLSKPKLILFILSVIIILVSDSPVITHLAVAVLPLPPGAAIVTVGALL